MEVNHLFNSASLYTSVFGEGSAFFLVQLTPTRISFSYCDELVDALGSSWLEEISNGLGLLNSSKQHLVLM
jgi:hypothetical protein